MIFYNFLKRWNFGFAFKDFWYRFDWRKLSKSSVRDFMESQLSTAYQLYADGRLPKLTGDRDTRAILGLRWVNEILKYNKDEDTFHAVEKWQTVYETLTRWYIRVGEDLILIHNGFDKPPMYPGAFRSGDCEDGAILLYCLLRMNGINPLQLKLVAGKVKEGGHCWIEYMPDMSFTDNSNLGEWYSLDWCYWFNPDKFKNRITANQDKNYVQRLFEVSIL